jgi:hypothetical protein
MTHALHGELLIWQVIERWLGYFVPGKTPRAVKDRLRDSVELASLFSKASPIVDTEHQSATSLLALYYSPL